jgi:hypothetical protein
LEIEEEFVLPDRAAEIGFERQTDAITFGNLSLEKGDPTAVAKLGFVHGGVGGTEDVGGFLAASAETGDAATGTGDDRTPVDYDRFLERGLDAAGGDLRGANIGDSAQQAGELVAAETSDEVAGADRSAKPVGEGDEELIAGGVTETVVDGFEAVEIEEKERGNLTVTRGAMKIAAEEIDQRVAIGQTGEGIVVGTVGELKLLLQTGVASRRAMR